MPRQLQEGTDPTRQDDPLQLRLALYPKLVASRGHLGLPIDVAFPARQWLNRLMERPITAHTVEVLKETMELCEGNLVDNSNS